MRRSGSSPFGCQKRTSRNDTWSSRPACSQTRTRATVKPCRRARSALDERARAGAVHEQIQPVRGTGLCSESLCERTRKRMEKQAVQRITSELH
jgi:hypothetical protein